ncbi:MAG TPA: lysophospholipid acyltransferase family protein [Thermodesulfobacteriota bacterium]|nr:lysophospholipid acyltransferase family protein [Thermodesulfobacteriota bacterium]
MIAYIVYLLLKGFSLFVNLLPEGFTLRFGRQLGKMVYYLDRGHRKVAIQNLHIAFDREKSEGEMRSIAKRAFENLGMMTVEFFRIPRVDVKTFKERVKIEGLEKALKLLEKKKGVLLLLGHFGNWELMGLMSKVIGNPIMVIAKPMKKNRWVDQFITKVRSAGGLEVISNIKAGRKVIQALSQNRVVGILIDQRAKRSEGIWADFFGRKAPTTPSLAVLAMKTGAPVLPVFMIRNGFQKHRLIIKEPLDLIRTGDIKKDVESNTQLFNDTLESMIRQHPDQWFWVHQRWERKKRTHHR